MPRQHGGASSKGSIAGSSFASRPPQPSLRKNSLLAHLRSKPARPSRVDFRLPLSVQELLAAFPRAQFLCSAPALWTCSLARPSWREPSFGVTFELERSAKEDLDDPPLRARLAELLRAGGFRSLLSAPLSPGLYARQCVPVLGLPASRASLLPCSACRRCGRRGVGLLGRTSVRQAPTLCSEPTCAPLALPGTSAPVLGLDSRRSGVLGGFAEALALAVTCKVKARPKLSLNPGVWV